MQQHRNVAIFVFDDVEVLDFAGPFEVFGVSYDESRNKLFNVYTVSETGKPVSARNDLHIMPTYSIHNMLQPDILVIPGGSGTRPLLENEMVVHWISHQHERVEHLLSVCTGALLLGKSGVLNGQQATTYHTEFDTLRHIAPKADVVENQRWVDNGKIITSAGVSAGIDMALHVVEKLHGREQADRTARYMEYEHWNGFPEVGK